MSSIAPEHQEGAQMMRGRGTLQLVQKHRYCPVSSQPDHEKAYRKLEYVAQICPVVHPRCHRCSGIPADIIVSTPSHPPLPDQTTDRLFLIPGPPNFPCIL